MTLFSFIVATFLVFLIFEAVPSASLYFFPADVDYYKVHRGFIEDPTLVFRRKPDYRRTSTYSGDLYRECFHTSPDPISFEIRTGADGFRYENPDRPDVVLLGDSYLMAAKNAADSLRYRLQKLSGLPTADFGTEWHGPCQYLEVFKRYGLPQKPRFAVLYFFEGNDLKDVEEYQRWKNGGVYYNYDVWSKNPFTRYFIASRETWGYIEKRSRAFLGIPSKNDCRSDLVEVRLGSRRITTTFRPTFEMRPVEQILNSPAATVLSGVFVEWARLCQENNIRPLVVFIPSAAHIYGPYVTPQQPGPGHALESAIKQIAQQASLPWMSLTPAFEQAAGEGNFLYYTFDTHWNSEARLIASQKIAEQLEILR